jgi:hypothetical protein
VLTLNASEQPNPNPTHHRSRYQHKSTLTISCMHPMYFGATNWGIWRVAIGVELGECRSWPSARRVDGSTVPAAAWKGMFYGTLRS